MFPHPCHLHKEILMYMYFAHLKENSFYNVCTVIHIYMYIHNVHVQCRVYCTILLIVHCTYSMCICIHVFMYMYMYM